MLIKHVVKACCGNSSIILELPKPIKKNQIHHFREARYAIPENFLQAGVFYVQFKGLIATTAFGSVKMNLRCNGIECEQLLTSFEALLLKAISE